MKKRVIICYLLLLAATAFALTGCAGAATAPYPPAAPQAAVEMAVPGAAAKLAGIAGNDMAIREEVAYEDGGEAYDMPAADVVENPATAGGVAGPAVTPVIDSRKIIRNVDLQLQTLSFEAGVDSIAATAERFGGYVQNSYVEGRDMYNERGTRVANFTLRIPSERLDSFVNSLGGEFNVTSKSQNSQDITDAYFDSKARLDALKVQEKRLIAMLEKAEELEYLLQVEKELMNVRYEIESLTASLARMDSYVSLSTVNIQLFEVVKYEEIEDVPVTFAERISRAYGGSWVAFSEFMQNLAVLAVASLPFLLLIVVLVIIVAVILRRISRRAPKKERHAPKNQAQAPPEEENGEK